MGTKLCCAQTRSVSVSGTPKPEAREGAGDRERAARQSAACVTIVPAMVIAIEKRRGGDQIQPSSELSEMTGRRGHQSGHQFRGR